MYIAGAEFPETPGFRWKKARDNLIEDRNGLSAAAMESHADGGAEHDAALLKFAENRELTRGSVHKCRLAVSECPPRHPTISTCKTPGSKLPGVGVFTNCNLSTREQLFWIKVQTDHCQGSLISPTKGGCHTYQYLVRGSLIFRKQGQPAIELKGVRSCTCQARSSSACMCVCTQHWGGWRPCS